jgi:hypothetical protein
LKFTLIRKNIFSCASLLRILGAMTATVTIWGCGHESRVQEPGLFPEPIAPREYEEPTDPKEKLFELERLGPQSVPDEEAGLPPKVKAKERLQLLDLGQQKDRESREISPQEKAKERIQKLEEGGLLVKPPAIPDLEVEPITQEEISSAKVSRIEATARAKQLLGVYAQTIGIYDEILGEVKPAPGYLARIMGMPDWLILGGEHRTRYENMNGQFRRDLRTVDEQLALRTRLVFGIKEILDPFRFTVELQDSRAQFSKTGSNVNDNHVNKLDIQQLTMDFVTSDFWGMGQSVLNLGRVNMDLGHGERARWIARNNYRNASNAYDGFHWRLGDSSGFQSHIFAAWPVDRLLTQTDRWFNNNDNFLWGGYFLLPPLIPNMPWLRTELMYHGHRSREAHRDFNMLGFRLIKEGGVGEWEFEVESEYQFGDINQFADFAQFYHGEVGYTFDLPWKPQLLLRFDYASLGFDILYGRRSFEMTPTGILGPFQRSNFAFPGYRVLLTPTNRFYMFAQHRAAWMVDPTGPWVGTGLQDPTGQSGNFLGQTVEFRARWQALDNVFLQWGYMYFAVGPFARNVPGTPVDRDVNYFHFSTEFMF